MPGFEFSPPRKWPPLGGFFVARLTGINRPPFVRRLSHAPAYHVLYPTTNRSENMSTEIYARAIGQAITHRRKALCLELAVGLAVAHDNKNDEAEGRAALVRVYADAGYDCLKPTGRDYKTVNRRVNMAFLLWNHLGGARKIRLGRVRGAEKLTAAKEIVAMLEVSTAYDVMDLVGRSQRRERETNSQRRESSMTRRATDQPGTAHIKTEHIDVPVPPTATKREVISLIRKLQKLADRLGGKKRHAVEQVEA
jgi:hypothetical protein